MVSIFGTSWVTVIERISVPPNVTVLLGEYTGGLTVTLVIAAAAAVVVVVTAVVAVLATIVSGDEVWDDVAVAIVPISTDTGTSTVEIPSYRSYNL
ncbi:hypothetical protein U1Q18_050071 [Sarracenia purpurea var. burkii]